VIVAGWLTDALEPHLVAFETDEDGPIVEGKQSIRARPGEHGAIGVEITVAALVCGVLEVVDKTRVHERFAVVIHEHGHIKTANLLNGESKYFFTHESFFAAIGESAVSVVAVHAAEIAGVCYLKGHVSGFFRHFPIVYLRESGLAELGRLQLCVLFREMTDGWAIEKGVVVVLEMHVKLLSYNHYYPANQFSYC